MIDANISEINGPYYQVKLHTIPYVGDTVDLYSFAEAADNRHQPPLYEVVSIEHHIYDVAEKIPNSHKGYHMITVHVKQSSRSRLSPLTVEEIADSVETGR